MRRDAAGLVRYEKAHRRVDSLRGCLVRVLPAPTHQGLRRHILSRRRRRARVLGSRDSRAGFREFVDWRPFEYFTSRTTTPVAGAFVRPQPATETAEFLSLGEHGTRIVWRFRVTNRSRISLLALRVFRPFWLAFWRRAGAALVSIAEEDAAAHPLDVSDT